MASGVEGGMVTVTVIHAPLDPKGVVARVLWPGMKKEFPDV
jgi:hypothetical protein